MKAKPHTEHVITLILIAILFSLMVIFAAQVTAPPATLSASDDFIPELCFQDCAFSPR